MPKFTIEAPVINIEEKDGGTYVIFDTSPGEGMAMGEAGAEEGPENMPAEMGGEAAMMGEAEPEAEGGADEFTGSFFTSSPITGIDKSKPAKITIEFPYAEGAEFNEFMNPNAEV